MERGTSAGWIMAIIGAALCAVLLSGAPSAVGMTVADLSNTPTATPVDLRTCQVGGRMAEYPQTFQGLVIQPYVQRDVGGYNEWETTWRAWGPAGRVIQAEVVTYRCIGLVRTPQWDHCSAALATMSMTHQISVTIPPSGTVDFSVRAPVDCCEIDQNDLMTVNGIIWGSSFFVRWAEAPFCLQRTSPTVTATPSSTPTATPTATHTPTPTATPPFRKTPWHEELPPGYSQRYNITVQNTTGSVLPNVVITDVLPSGLRFSDATIVVTGTVPPAAHAWYPSGGEWDGNRTIVWRVGDLAPGLYATMKVHGYVYGSVRPGTVLTNVAWLQSGNDPPVRTEATMLVVESPTTPTPRATPTFTPVPECPPAPVVQVNAGSSIAYTDARGTVWQTDRRYQPGLNTWGYIGDSSVYSTSNPIGGTGDQPLYQTERFWLGGSGGYRFEVTNGDYLVLLKFAEIYPEAVPGRRVFSVNVEGTPAASHLDVADVVGMNVAFDLLVPTHMDDGILAVDFIPEASLPAVKAIAVLSPRGCTPTATPSPTPSNTPTATQTATVTATPSETATPTASDTPMPTPADTATATPSATPTPTATETETVTPSATPSATETATPTMTFLPTKTAIGTSTSTPTATATLTATPDDTPTPTPSPTATHYTIVLPIIICCE